MPRSNGRVFPKKKAVKVGPISLQDVYNSAHQMMKHHDEDLIDQIKIGEVEINTKRIGN